MTSPPLENPSHLENPQNITVRITNRSFNKSYKISSRTYGNLITVSVKQTLTNNGIATDCQDWIPVLQKRLRFACANSRSVRNKIAVFIDHMVDSGIDICTITEMGLIEGL